jgi:hypothetical protein
MALGLIQTSVEKFLLCITLNLRLRTLVQPLTSTRTFPYSRNLESISRPRLLFGNRQGFQLMDPYRIHLL